MDPNSYPFLLVHQAEREIRFRQSERRREAERAAGIQSTGLPTFPFRAWISAALIAVGERMQAKITIEPANADSIGTITASR